MDGKRLHIVIQNGSLVGFKESTKRFSRTNDVVCEFDVDKLEAAFDNTWSECQKIEDSTAQEKVHW